MLFFDSGCSDLVCRQSAVKRMGKRASQVVKGPIYIGGVGETRSESEHGVFEVRLPLHTGKNAVLSGICLDKITSTFPQYPLQGEVENDVCDAYSKTGDVSDLPCLPKSVGGDVDFMVGVKYLKYHPEHVFSLPSGLTIYCSPFLNIDGSRGVIGGPHSVFTAIRDSFGSKMCELSYLSEQCKLYKAGYQISLDESMFKVSEAKEFDVVLEDISEAESADSKVNEHCYTTARRQKYFQEVENAATEVLYRCVDCRKCSKCKSGDRIEMISIKEVKQDLINKSVKVDAESGVTTAHLPFLSDPVLKLAPNKEKALAVYKGQVKKLSKNPQEKRDVLESERKLQKLGYVDYVHNLAPEDQKKLTENPIQNFIPWRYVWNENSLTTPCRIVFDASMPTSSSYSLNDLVAKGRNNMNRLVEVFIRWRSHFSALHTDIHKMYNSVRLVNEHWSFQRYVWQDELDPGKIPQQKIIKTLIYGIKSSGNQAEHGLRETARIFQETYPDVAQIVNKDIYVDDCLSGSISSEVTYRLADELSLVLKKGGFLLKGFTFSGQLPLLTLSSDGESVNVAGVRWYSKDDEFRLDVKEMNFSKKSRGKKSKIDAAGKIPERLTRRQCVSRVSEIFDLTGLITPLTAHLKLDLHVLVKNNLGWDDAVPDSLRSVWKTHFEMIEEINKIKFRRAVVPEDAVSLKIDTIDAGDASQEIACAAVYVRFLRKSGDHSCQLVFARSKLLPEGITQPRAELVAASLNAHVGEVVKRSFGKLHISAAKLTDSQITLHWINNRDLPLKQWVRNRVVDICRLTDPLQWVYIQSSDMIADIGTRRGVSINEVLPDSTWNKGFTWMTYDSSKFPVKKYEEIKDSLSSEKRSDVKDEVIVKETVNEHSGFLLNSDSYLSTKVPEEVTIRYDFSNYIFDPNAHTFSRCVRVIGIILRFIKNCRSKVLMKSAGSPVKKVDVLQGEAHVSSSIQTKCHIVLSDDEIKEAANYYYRKASEEVMKFANEKLYKNISFKKDGILYYTGRILPTQEINSVSSLSNVMKDLSCTSFVVPIVEKYSPVAYSVVSEVHWENKVAKHSGVETVLRYTMEYCYILDGRELVKQFRRNCQRCRYLRKRTIEVAMGPVSTHNLTIAPAFFVSQVDLAGPFKAYSLHNKRTTVKVWLVVFCCSTTSTTNIKVMEDYTASGFLQAFVRFSCEVGYPKVLLTDEGSQLVKGCETVRFDFKDTQNKLHVEIGVELEICPVGGHNMHGKVERKIKHIKESLAKSVHNERLSVLQWETVGAEIANSINDLPLALGSRVADLEYLDLLTPNRLKLGRNNERSPVGPLFVTGKPEKFLTENKKIFDSWFQQWLISHVPDLIPQPKWFNNDLDVSEGDVVLFRKEEGKVLSGNYQYGVIKTVERSRDGKARSAIIKYRNHNENIDRNTRRAVRAIVMIHPVDELSIITELGEIASAVDVKRRLQHDV